MSEVDEFLVNPEDAVEGEGYIQPNIEAKLSSKKRQECREIVQEIRQFGISQRQLVYLIYLLSLDLENLELMKSLTKQIGEQRDNVPLTNKDLGNEIELPAGSKIIL